MILAWYIGFCCGMGCMLVLVVLERRRARKTTDGVPGGENDRG